MIKLWISTGFRISLLAIAPGDSFLWGWGGVGCRRPNNPRAAVGGLRPPTPLRKVGLRPPCALDPILDGALGPIGPGPRLDLELFGPKMGFWEIEKQKGASLGPNKMGTFGLKLGPNEA